uniref:HNH endonuclease n=1 Tax=Streptococcus plurextorum TaxID=456876 RepID=UPI00146E6B82
EGLEQGVKNLDSFKGLVKHVGQFGENVLKNIDHYAKQVGNLTKGKVASAADNLASQLRHVDDTLSKAAQNFSLNNIGFIPQPVGGASLPPSPGKLADLADNLQAFAKSLSGSVDEVVESGVTLGNKIRPLDLSDTDIFRTKPKNSPTPHKWMDKGGKIDIDYSKIPPEWIYTDWEGNIIKYTDGFPDFKDGIPPQVKKEFILEDGFETRAKDFSRAGKSGPDNTWHHHQDGKTLQLVDREIHRRFTHRGGISIIKNGGK